MSVYDSPALACLSIVLMFSMLIVPLAKTKKLWLFALLLHIAMLFLIYLYDVKAGFIFDDSISIGILEIFPLIFILISEDITRKVKIADAVISLIGPYSLFIISRGFPF